MILRIVDPTYANTPVYSSSDTFVQSGWPSELSTTVDLSWARTGPRLNSRYLDNCTQVEPRIVTTGTVTVDDWQHQSLQYADASGNAVNTAAYGAGAWQLTAADYNDQGNVARELDERALRLLSDGGLPTRPGTTVEGGNDVQQRNRQYCRNHW